MFDFLKALFFRQKAECVIDAHWLDTAIKLPNKITTPLGSKVSSVTVCVDITYSISSEYTISVHKVTLSKAGGSIGKSAVNMAGARTGEAWFARRLEPNVLLVEAVQTELTRKNSPLQKRMFGKWRATR